MLALHRHKRRFIEQTEASSIQKNHPPHCKEQLRYPGAQTSQGKPSAVDLLELLNLLEDAVKGNSTFRL